MALLEHPIRIDASDIAGREAHRLAMLYDRVRTIDLLDDMINVRFAGEVAVVSSFGAESSVLLHLVSRVNPAAPVLFVDTGKHFGETRSHRDQLREKFGLTDVRSLKPDPARLAEADRDGGLWLRDPDACCRIRKVEPLARGLAGFTAWVSGRKRFQGGDRTELALFEPEGDRIKINPLATWSSDDIEIYQRAHDLPRHPLIDPGYKSIGCMPCTAPVGEGDDDRAGRWKGQDKTECGIHFGALGVEHDGSGI